MWKIRANVKGRSDFDFFVTLDDKYSIYFSNIDEYGIMKFASPVQIWTDKENPRLLFESNKIHFEYQKGESCYYLNKSDILVLLTPCIRQNSFDLPYVLFDFNRSMFTTINAPNFKLTEIDRNIVQLDIHFRYNYDGQTREKILTDNGRRIDLAQQEWHEVNNIDKVCSLMMKNNR